MIPPSGRPVEMRRPWWAVFSVRAHQNLRALAADILLYDRVVLPRPAGPDEEQRFEAAGWDPELLDAVERQAADSVFTVLWSEALREEWGKQVQLISGASADAAYGATSLVMAQTEAGHKEIYHALDPDTAPDARPILIAAFQSEEEAMAQLALRHDDGAALHTTPAHRALAIEISRIVEEPAVRDSEQAFLIAAELASNAQFCKARGNLLSWIDHLAMGHSVESALSRLDGLEEEYKSAVHDFGIQTWKRRAVSVIPWLGGVVAGAAGAHGLEPLAAKGLGTTATWSLKKVTGRFTPEWTNPDDVHPGHAVSLMRAAYRDAQPQACVEQPIDDSR
jgi:hypothetical protein